MGDSRRFPPADVPADAPDPPTPTVPDTAQAHDVRAAVAAALARALPHGGRIAIGFSGGRDSAVLLDAALAVRADARCDVVALHVHHGLSAHADDWSRFCRDTCATLGVPFAMRRVCVEGGARVSIEAAARKARHAALAELAQELDASAVLLGHHADDQAETLLLQLFRGAGPRGLAAMPAAKFDRGLWWLRPLLGIPRARIDGYAGLRDVRYVDDDSNDDSRYRRNALRHRVVPLLRAVAPGYPRTLLRAAELQADAATLLDDLARIDARDACDGTTLDCAALRKLDRRRAQNLLRWFLREQGLPAPSRARLAEMLRQLAEAGRDAQVALSHAGAWLGVHRGRVTLHRSPGAAFVREWTGAATIDLPHGVLVLRPQQGAGIAARHLAGPGVTIRSGVAGERLQLAGRSTRRQVADLLRDAGIPHWDRLALPRVYCGPALAAVAPLGVDVAFAAAHDEPAFALDWHPATDRDEAPAPVRTDA